MLAYVFWHFPAAQAQLDTYERGLERFHAALADAGIDGFQTSVTFRVAHVPWVPADDAYEDWYLLRDSGTLDAINQAAIRDRARAPHDELAAVAAWGTAGLYRLRSGSFDPSAGHAYWFSKPASMSYAELDDRLMTFAAEAASLWQRRMTLGPGTEYCLMTARELQLPAILSPKHVSRNALA
jgi:hypothetical protein